MSEFWAGFMLGTCGLVTLSTTVGLILSRMIATFNPSDEQPIGRRPVSSLNGHIVYERERRQ